MAKSKDICEACRERHGLWNRRMTAFVCRKCWQAIRLGLPIPRKINVTAIMVGDESEKD